MTRTCLICISLVAISVSGGCGKPAYMLRADEARGCLAAIASTNDVNRWAVEQIEGHMPSPNKRPSSALIDAPTWAKEVYMVYSEPRVTIRYDEQPENDHVELGWASGLGGVFGMFVGRTNFLPKVGDRGIYVLECKPGLYVWLSRRQY